MVKQTRGVKGHWTKEPPTEPGWYIAYYITDKKTECVFINSRKWLYRINLNGPSGRGVFDYYWSEPIELPEPPEEL